MNKREIRLADGRYVILYTFEPAEGPRPGTAGAAREQPAPSATEPEREHSRSEHSRSEHE